MALEAKADMIKAKLDVQKSIDKSKEDLLKEK